MCDTQHTELSNQSAVSFTAAVGLIHAESTEPHTPFLIIHVRFHLVISYWRNTLENVHRPLHFPLILKTTELKKKISLCVIKCIMLKIVLRQTISDSV